MGSRCEVARGDQVSATREFRCPHGFYRSQVRCVECDAAEKPIVARPAPEPTDVRVTPAGHKYKYESKVNGRRYRCTSCGEFGHGKATCVRRMAVAAGVVIPSPKLKSWPIPAEHAEPAPKRDEKRSA